MNIGTANLGGRALGLVNSNPKVLGLDRKPAD